MNGRDSGGVISLDGQTPVALVVETNEELMIAQETVKVVQK